MCPTAKLRLLKFDLKAWNKTIFVNIHVHSTKGKKKLELIRAKMAEDGFLEVSFQGRNRSSR